MVYTPDSIHIFLRQSIMLKADIALFNDLTSSDDAVRIEAATKLEQHPCDYFREHPTGKFRYEPAQIQSLLEGWKSTRSDLVKTWIAQVLAIAENGTGDAWSLMADTLKLKLDGPYMEWVAQEVYQQRDRISGGNDILRGLHNHPNSEVRWRCAMALRSFAFHNELTVDDRALLRRLMLDTDASVRKEAVQAAEKFPELGPEDYEILLDVENIDSGNARIYAQKLMTKLEATVPGCRREAFAPRVPLLRTEGVYCVNREELDAAGRLIKGSYREGLDTVGRWIKGTYLRFLPDGTTHIFLAGDLPADFIGRLPWEHEHIASGAFSKDGARVTFSCVGKEGCWRYDGHIDGDELHLNGEHVESGHRVKEVYGWRWTPQQWTPLNWNTAPASKAVAKKGALPFIPLKPRSMSCSEAAKWYLQMVARLPLLLETEATPEDSRLAVVWETRQQLRETAARSLYDPALKKEFLAEMPLPPLDELRALHGDAALQELFKITQAEVRAFPGTIGEAIGMTCWDGKETWVMTEQGWQRQEAQA